MKKKPSVVLLGPGELPPDDGDEWIEPPKGNDRMWSVVLHNRGRETRGTLTIHRLHALLFGLKMRYPKIVKSKMGKPLEPVVYRRERAGKIVAVVDVLAGPVSSVATRQ